MTLGGATGCGRGERPIAARGPAAPLPEAVLVRVGPLVAEHPLYPEVLRLTRLLEQRRGPNLEPAAQFMAAPLDRVFATLPEPGPAPQAQLGDWQAEADAGLAASLEEAGRILASIPPPEGPATGTERAREAQDEMRQAESDALLRIARAEMRAIEERRGDLAEIRGRQASEEAAEAARALDREAEVWREIEARVAATRRQADEELRALRAEVEKRLGESAQAMQAVAEQDRESHLERLRRSGEEVRMAQQPAVAAATRGLSPDDGGSDLPAPPATGRFVALLRTVERAQGRPGTGGARDSRRRGAD
jgi:hypothetical protein